MDSKLKEYLEIWDGASYREDLTEDVYDFGYNEGSTDANIKFKEYLEKKKAEADKKKEDAYENGDMWDYYIAEQNKQLFTDIINELFNDEYRNEDTSDNDE